MLKKFIYLTFMIFLFSLTVFSVQWIPMSGSAKDVGISSDGAVWVIGTNKVYGGFGIYRWTIDQWEQKPGGAQRISVGSSKDIWVVNDKGSIFKWVPSKNNWEQKPGTAKDIGVGVDGTVWIIGTKSEGEGYGIYKWIGSNWEKKPGNAVRISVGSSKEIWVVNNKGKIFKWLQRKNSWEQKPGTAKDIGVGADGTVWVIGTKPEFGGYGIYEWTGSGWEKKPGVAEQISVGSIKHILVSNKTNNIFLWQKGTFSNNKGSEIIRATPGTTLDKTRRKNPFLPIMVRLIRRYLAEKEDMNRLDRAFRDAVQEVGGINRRVLEKISNVYMQMDNQERSSKFETIALEKGDLAPITIKEIKLSFQRVNPALFAPQLEWTSDISLGLPPPQLTAIKPTQSSKGYSPGVLLILTGNHFSPVAKQNGIEILAQGASTRSFGVVPVTSTKNQMQFLLPKDINSGIWRLRVLVGANKTPSNELAFQVYVPPKPLSIPYVNGISPKPAKPGDKVYINGKNFNQQVNLISMKTLNVKPEWSKTIFNSRVIGTALNQLEMKIPKYAPPCQYTMQVITLYGASNKVPYTVAGYKYRVVFDEMHCIDETNPETGGTDDMVTFWVVISDDKSIYKNTSEYSGFNDGSKYSYKPSDALVLDWTEIKKGLSVATELWEWDEGDIESAKKVVAISGKVASKLIGWIWGSTAGTVAGEIMKVVVDAFDWIAKNIFGVENDRMGRIIQNWSQQKLIDTLNPQKPKKYTLNFKDHGGEYNVYFTLFCKI